jgi:hypothetical protein
LIKFYSNKGFGRNVGWGVFENRVLRRVLLPKRQDVTEEWRKVHNDQLNDLYSSPNIVRVIKSRIRCAGRVACMGKRRGVYRVLLGKPERKRPLGRPRCKWEDNIKLHLQEVICEETWEIQAQMGG